MTDDSRWLHTRIAERLRHWRAVRGLSLETLATRSGVSRSMISCIERGESNPTAVLLDRLAQALDVPLASLFEDGAGSTPLCRRAEQAVWQDPASGYRRRNVSPPGPGGRTQIVEVEFPAGATVAYDHLDRPSRVEQQVWLQTGRLTVTVGGQAYPLEAGDCLAMTLDCPIGYHNPGDQPARYVVVLTRSLP